MYFCRHSFRAFTDKTGAHHNLEQMRSETVRENFDTDDNRPERCHDSTFKRHNISQLSQN